MLCYHHCVHSFPTATTITLVPLFCSTGPGGWAPWTKTTRCVPLIPRPPSSPRASTTTRWGGLPGSGRAAASPSCATTTRRTAWWGAWLHCWRYVWEEINTQNSKKNSQLPQVIMRSGQPLIGANKRRCKEDEDLLQAVIQGSDKGYIIDTRSSQQAQQARVAGGGFESKSSYSRWKRLHRQMERCARARAWWPDDECYFWSTLIKLASAVAGESPCRRAWSNWLKPAATRRTTWTAGSVSWRTQSGCLTSRLHCQRLGCWQSAWRGMNQHPCTAHTSRFCSVQSFTLKAFAWTCSCCRYEL